MNPGGRSDLDYGVLVNLSIPVEIPFRIRMLLGPAGNNVLRSFDFGWPSASLSSTWGPGYRYRWPLGRLMSLLVKSTPRPFFCEYRSQHGSRPFRGYRAPVMLRTAMLVPLSAEIGGAPMFGAETVCFGSVGHEVQRACR
jgi:hypothetical protein